MVNDASTRMNDEKNILPKVPNGERLLFDGATVNRGHALTLAIAFAIRHQLTNAARQDLLTLLNTLLPDCVPPTNYFLDKLFFKSDNLSEIHMYCSDCQNYFGQSLPASKKCDHCKCVVTRDDCIAKGNYMLVVPMQQQLKDMLEITDLFSVLDRSVGVNNIISTVRDGSLYRNSENTMFLNDPNNLSLSWSCDGVPVFKSAKYSIWPLYASINELPLLLRRKFISLTALWFGTSKPRMYTFLRCFVNETQVLYSEGFSWTKDGTSYVTKVITLTCVCDAPARALVQKLRPI